MGLICLSEKDVLGVFLPTWRSPYCGLGNCTRRSSTLICIFVETNLLRNNARSHVLSASGVYQAAHSAGHRNSSARGFSDIYQAAHCAGHCNSSARGFSDVYQATHFAGLSQ